MKHLAIIFFCVITFIKCNDSDIVLPDDEQDYRTIAYKSLSQQEKESIISDWENAKVLQGVYQKNGDANIFVIDSESSYYFLLIDSTAKLNDGHKLASVTFHTKDDSLLGPITVIIDSNTKRAIGGLARL